MSSFDARDVPADETSRERLAAAGLAYRITDPSDAHVPQAVARGFLEPAMSEAAVTEEAGELAYRRAIGVFDETGFDPETPVATAASWISPLTVPGGELDMWAISNVTVAGTHRRRGIARAMLEGELRAAVSADLAVAGLTVSEATIYGRYGFGSAVPVSRVTIDTHHAGWSGRVPAGRVEYIDRERLAIDLGEVHERMRAQRAGQIQGWPRRWKQFSGLSVGAKDGESVRGVRYRDEEGEVRGALAYRIEGMDRADEHARLVVQLLVADTADAEAALWRFAVQHDLIAEVTARLRPVDDPIRWLVHNERAVEQQVHDHGWLRILDVERALLSRTYAAAASAVIRVNDQLGIADGVYRVDIGSDGRAVVERTAAGPELTLDIAQLSAIWLGGVPLTSLVRAGRVAGGLDAAAVLDTALRPALAPSLAIVY